MVFKNSIDQREKNMAIITISRGSYSRGKEVAEKVAAKLGYQCLSREVILEASEHYRVPEIKMIRAIHDAPSILERIGHSKQAFIAYYQSELTAAVQPDNVVYHGLAGHLLLKGIQHVLKVRIIADLADRVSSEMKRDGIGEQEARALILKDDQERRRWTQSLYGSDPWDSSLYDLVIHINKFKVSDAVDLISRAAVLKQFKATRESRQKMDDLVLASRIKAALVDVSIEVAVLSEYGNVLIYTKSDDRISRKLEEKFKTLHGKINGINNIEFHPGVPFPPNAI
jgi:cytidylate kinase